MIDTMTPPGKTRRWLTVISGVIAVGMFAGSTWLRRPTLEIPQEVPIEVTELSNSTWEAFLAAFPAQRDCIGTVTMRLTRSVEGGDAMYRPPERTIYVEIPTTPARFPESLAHELGHHLESACNAEAELGVAFRRAEALPPAVAWSGIEPWYDSPSEHFAEAVVEIVRSERITHPDIVVLEPAAVQLVRTWGATGDVESSDE